MTLLGDFDRAYAHSQQALDLATQLGDPVGCTDAHHEFTWVLGRSGRWSEALPHADAALDLYQASGDRGLQPRALNGVGYCLTALGQDHHRAIALCQQGLAIFRDKLLPSPINSL